jgi:hypothetical protein
MQPKFLLIFLLSILSVSAHSQFVKGNRMVGATIASSLFSSGKTDLSGPNQLSIEQTNKNFTLQFTPSMGWFVSDKTVVGASMLVSVYNQKATNESGGVNYKEDENNNLDFGAGVFARQYLSTSNQMRPFVHLHLTVGSGSTETEGYYYYTLPGDIVKDTYTGSSKGKFFYNAGVNAGLTRMLNQNAGLDLFIGYLYSYNKRTTTSTLISDHTNNGLDTRSEYESTQKFAGHGFTFGIGFQVFLSKK